MAETQTALGRLVPEALVQLEQRKQALLIVEQLERRTHPHGDANEFCWGFPRAIQCRALKTISLAA